MDRFCRPQLSAASDRPDRTLLDILAAIELVAAGGALRMVLSGLPDVELVAAEALAAAQAAGVAFVLMRDPGAARPSVVVGPIDA